jgi:archaellum component FlaC
MDHLNDQAATEAHQDAAAGRDLDVFAQAAGAADARLRGEPATSEPQNDEQHGDNQTGATTGDDEQHQQEAASAAEQQAASEDDLFSDASPEQRAYLQSLLADRDREAQAARSANGRYAATQRQLAEKERQFNEQINSIQQADKQGDGKDATRQLDALESRIAAMREDYPDIADHMQGVADALRDGLRSEISQVKEPVAQLREQAKARQHEELITIETDELMRRHPDAEKVVVSQEFQAWIAQQPVSLQGIANSDSAADADVVLTLYKSTQLQAQAQRNAQRQRKLADMAPLGGSQGRATVDTGDESSAFSRAAADADKRLAQRKY